jgi:hypothetical protein
MRTLWSAAGIWSPGWSKDFNNATAQAFKYVQVLARLYQSTTVIWEQEGICGFVLSVSVCWP